MSDVATDTGSHTTHPLSLAPDNKIRKPRTLSGNFARPVRRHPLFFGYPARICAHPHPIHPARSASGPSTLRTRSRLPGRPQAPHTQPHRQKALGHMRPPPRPCLRPPTRAGPTRQSLRTAPGGHTAAPPPRQSCVGTSRALPATAVRPGLPPHATRTPRGNASPAATAARPSRHHVTDRSRGGSRRAAALTSGLESSPRLAAARCRRSSRPPAVSEAAHRRLLCAFPSTSLLAAAHLIERTMTADESSSCADGMRSPSQAGAGGGTRGAESGDGRARCLGMLARTWDAFRRALSRAITQNSSRSSNMQTASGPVRPGRPDPRSTLVANY
jgi:hypothetical protein